MPGPITTKEHLDALLGVAQEVQRLEFKEDIPVHETRAKEQVKGGLQRGRDTWWDGCRSIAQHGRDEILAEIVAFANAQGGTLVLGIEEDDARTAKALSPLPKITALEDRFRAFLVEHIEPRLAYCRVQGIQTELDGSGVLVFEIEPSRLGPHWVRYTRRATIRRDDRCMPLSMSEIQDMTLRNARRFDEVRSSIDVRLGALDTDFTEFLLTKVTTNANGVTNGQRVATGLKHVRRSAFAIRSVIIAHEDIGIPRLPTFSALVPPQTCVGIAGLPAMRDLTVFWPRGTHERRFLGGVRDGHTWDSGRVDYLATREGVVEATAMIIGNEGESTSLSRHLLVGILGCSIGVYDNLRELSGRLQMPAEIAVSIRVFGDVHVANADNHMAAIAGGRLPPVSIFPRRSAADAPEFSAILTDTAQDLLDDADSRVGQGVGPMQFRYYPKLGT